MRRPSPPNRYHDVVKAAKYEAIIQSTLTTCTGQPLCLETITVGSEQFVGVGTKCEQRFFWTNEAYLQLTEEEHYANSRRLSETNGTDVEKVAIDARTQTWVISTNGGCLQQLHDFDEHESGHRLGLDPSCSTGHDTEFFAIGSPTWDGQALNDLQTPFAFVESHPNRTRRIAWHINATSPYVTEAGENCTCVDDPSNNPLASLMTSQAHVHEEYPNNGGYFWGRSHCDAHVFHTLLYPPSPPPPVSDRAPPPAPPYHIHQLRMVTGAFATTGMFFFGCCFCCWFGVNGRTRGGGRAKWFGVGSGRVDRPPLDRADDRGFFPTQRSAAQTPLLNSASGFFNAMFE